MFFIKNESENLYKLQSKNDNEIIDKKELENRWRDIILLVEAQEEYKEKDIAKTSAATIMIAFSTICNLPQFRHIQK